MALIDDLARFAGGCVALDTMVFIYAFEDHPAFGPEVLPLLRAIEAGRFTAVTSSVSAAECLVHPYRKRDRRLIAAYRHLFRAFPNLDTRSVTLAVGERAARLRATLNLRTPDALQAATALEAGCPALVTGDAFPAVPGLPLVRLRPPAA